MRRWWKSAGLVWGAGLLVLSVPAASSAAPCDEFDPWGPSRSTQIRLDASDFVDEAQDEMRSFVATDSIGKVDVAIVSSNPHGVVRAVSAVPEVSGFSPYYGERLKGIAVAVSLWGSARPASVVINVRQVCARYFRNTFLYY
jgi:hypothetical protein